MTDGEQKLFMNINPLIRPFAFKFELHEFLRLQILAHINMLDLLLKIFDFSLEGEQLVIAEDGEGLFGDVFRFIVVVGLIIHRPSDLSLHMSLCLLSCNYLIFSALHFLKPANLNIFIMCHLIYSFNYYQNTSVIH